MDTYRSIAEPVIGEYKEKNSKFLAYAYFIEAESELKELVDSLRKEHFKACHFCYAYRIGLGKDNYRANDDGEPSGTAGRPILGQIDSFELTNLLIVVVRYYGGTKLGTSGLKNAYKQAAQEALKLASIQEFIVEEGYCLEADYVDYNDLMSYIKAADLKVYDTQYTANRVSLFLRVRLSAVEDLKQKVEESWPTASCDLVSI